MKELVFQKSLGTFLCEDAKAKYYIRMQGIIPKINDSVTAFYHNGSVAETRVTLVNKLSNRERGMCGEDVFTIRLEHVDSVLTVRTAYRMKEVESVFDFHAERKNRPPLTFDIKNDIMIINSKQRRYDGSKFYALVGYYLKDNVLNIVTIDTRNDNMIYVTSDARLFNCFDMLIEYLLYGGVKFNRICLHSTAHADTLMEMLSKCISGIDGWEFSLTSDYFTDKKLKDIYISVNKVLFKKC